MLPGGTRVRLHVRDLRNPLHHRYEPDHWSCHACNEVGNCRLTLEADKFIKLCGPCKHGGLNRRPTDPAGKGWCCPSGLKCTYMLVCKQCYEQCYWDLNPTQRDNHAQHRENMAAAASDQRGTPMHGESWKRTVRRFARDCLLPQRLHSGVGKVGDRLIFRIATVAEIAAGYTAPGVGAFA